jgi:hypothetical protein
VSETVAPVAPIEHHALGGLRRPRKWLHRVFAVLLVLGIVAGLVISGMQQGLEAQAAVPSPDNDPSDLILGLPTSVLEAMAGGNVDVAAQLANLARYSPDIAKAADKLTAGSIDMTEFEKEIAQTSSRWSVPDFVDEAEQLNTGTASARANVVVLGGLASYNGARLFQGMAFNRDNTLCTAYAAGGFDGALAYGQAWADNILSTGLWQSPVTKGGCPNSQRTSKELEADGLQTFASLIGLSVQGVSITQFSEADSAYCYRSTGSYDVTTNGVRTVVVFDGPGLQANFNQWPFYVVSSPPSSTDTTAWCPGKKGVSYKPKSYVPGGISGLTTVTVSSSGTQVQTGQSATQTPAVARGTTTVKCTDGTSTVLAQVDGSTDASKVSNPVPKGDECAQHGDIDSLDLGVQQQVSDGSWTDMPDGTQTLTEPDVVRDWKTQYPQCTSGGCKLDLKKITGGDTELDCFDDPDECLDWKENTSQYKCYYAGVVVDLAECNIYAKVFDQNAVQQGQGYANPETGESPKTNTDPDTGGQTEINTNPGAQEFDSTEGDPSTSEDAQNAKCWPSGWGVFNPFQWVYMPVKCALRWAFVPKTSQISEMQNGSSSKQIEAAQTWANGIHFRSPGSDCSGLVVPMHVFSSAKDQRYLASCAGDDFETARHISYYTLAFACVVACGFACIRAFSSTFGYHSAYVDSKVLDLGNQSGGDSK